MLMLNVDDIQAHIKMESYGYAVSDATKALELDPTYVKVYCLLSWASWYQRIADRVTM